MIGIALSKIETELRDQAAQVADSTLAPLAARWDEEERFPDESWDAMIEGGLTGLTISKEYGGKGYGPRQACIVLEEVARGCAASALALQFNLNGPPKVIESLGSADLKDRLLPGAADATRYFAVAMTEPEAGSAATELTTTLTPTSDGYSLSGEKCYITGGLRADTFLVFCRIKGSRGAKGLGAVIVEAGAPGFAPPTSEPKMGGRGIAEASLKFDNVPISPSDVVIKPIADSTEGAKVMLKQFNPERCGNAAICIGVSRAALDSSVAFMKSREQFGRPIAEFQGLQWKVADMALDIEASQLLLRAATSDLDAEGFPDLKATVMAKLYANEMAQRVTNAAIQLHGHRGYTRSDGIERMFRDVRGMAIGGGTTEILRNLLASDVLGQRYSQRR